MHCCPICGYATAFPKRLEQHREICRRERLQFVQQEAGEGGKIARIYVCDLCDLEFSEKREMVIHKTLQHEAKPDAGVSSVPSGTHP